MNLDQDSKKIFRELNETLQQIDNERLTFEELKRNAKAVQLGTKSLREMWRQRDPSRERDAAFENSIESLMKVIEAFVLRLSQMEEGSLSERDIASEIGDYFGIQGGTFRDWGKFEEAARAYEKGVTQTKRVKELGGKFNSYCQVQELINLVLAHPEAMNPSSGLVAKLRTTLDQIRQNPGSRPDPWAQADQALITQLVDPEKAVGEWDTFEDLNPKKDSYSATRNVVDALFEKLRPHLTGSSLESWNDLRERLRTSESVS